MTYGLTDGGRAGMVYVYLASFVGFFAAVISMAEIASMSVTLMAHRVDGTDSSLVPRPPADNTTGSASLLVRDLNGS